MFYTQVIKMLSCFGFDLLWIWNGFVDDDSVIPSIRDKDIAQERIVNAKEGRDRDEVVNISTAEEARPVTFNTDTFPTTSTSLFATTESEHREPPVEVNKLTLPQRYALSIAQNPGKHLSVALLFCIIITASVIQFGNFTILATNEGLLTRHTAVSDKATQMLALNQERESEEDRTLKEVTEISSCEIDLLGKGVGFNLNSVWKTIDADELSPVVSALDADALYEMCLAEEATLQILEEHDLCYQCPIDKTDDNSAPKKCIQPFSLVAMTRLYLNMLNGKTDLEFYTPTITCDELQSKWTRDHQSSFTSILKSCTLYTMEVTKLIPVDDGGEQSKCAWGDLGASLGALVDTQFIKTGQVRVTSSIYATKDDDESASLMFEAFSSTIDEKDTSSFQAGLYELGVNSLYTTSKFGFYELYIFETLPKELRISIAALIMTSLCILLVTRSPFLTLLGIVQIIMALPVAYFIYYFICGLSV